MKTLIAAIAVAALAGLAIAAEPAPHAHGVDANTNAGKSCFRTSDIRSHKLTEDSIYLRVGAKDVYRLETTGNCKGGHFDTDPLVIDPAPVNGMVCSPVDLTLKIGRSNDLSMPTGCIVRGMRKLTPQEVAALPAKLRP